MKTITFTQGQLEDMLSVLDVDLFEITARDISYLVEHTPLTRDIILNIADQQLSVRHKTLITMLEIESEDALAALMEEDQ